MQFSLYNGQGDEENVFFRFGLNKKPTESDEK